MAILRIPWRRKTGGMVQTLTAGDDTPQTPQTGLIVRVDSPTALLTVIPHLLGFRPQGSVVVIGLAAPRDRIKVTLRYDLPDSPDAVLATEIAAHAVGVIGSQRLTAMVAVGYGAEAQVDPVAGALRYAARKAGIDLQDFLRVEGGRYWSYLCRDEACCPAAGASFDPDSGPASAAALSAVPGYRPDSSACQISTTASGTG